MGRVDRFSDEEFSISDEVGAAGLAAVVIFIEMARLDQSGGVEIKRVLEGRECFLCDTADVLKTLAQPFSLQQLGFFQGGGHLHSSDAFEGFARCDVFRRVWVGVIRAAGKHCAAH